MQRRDPVCYRFWVLFDGDSPLSVSLHASHIGAVAGLMEWGTENSRDIFETRYRIVRVLFEAW